MEKENHPKAINDMSPSEVAEQLIESIKDKGLPPPGSWVPIQALRRFDGVTFVADDLLDIFDCLDKIEPCTAGTFRVMQIVIYEIQRCLQGKMSCKDVVLD